MNQVNHPTTDYDRKRSYPDGNLLTAPEKASKPTVMQGGIEAPLSVLEQLIQAKEQERDTLLNKAGAVQQEILELKKELP